MTTITAGRLTFGACIVALLLLAARFAAGAPERISVLQSLQIDAAAYDAIAASLSAHWSAESIPPLQPPGFVTFLAVVFTWFGHSWTAGRMALWMCLVVATGLGAIVARTMYGRANAGWCAALLCAASPALHAYAGTLQYELLASVLLLALIWGASHVGSRRPSAAASTAVTAAALGLLTGVAVLTRELFVVVIPIVALYLMGRMSSAGRGRRVASIAAIAYVVCALIPPAAWSSVQSARTGRLVAVSDKAPLVLAFGNNPAANGTFNAPLAGVREPSGWAFIRARPAAALWLAGRKALYFWGVLRDGWNVPRPAAIVAARAVGGTVPLQQLLPWARGGLLLIVLAVALALWSRARWRVWWFAPAVILAFMAVHMITVSSYRFAVPVLPLVFAIVAGPVSAAAAAVWRHRGARTVAMCVVLFVVAMQFGRWPLVYRLTAYEFDGFSASHMVDAGTGESVRVADVAAGRRAVLLLVDEYLPEGRLDVEVAVRTTGTAPDPATDLFRIMVATFDGRTACDRTVTATDVSHDHMTRVVTRCALPRSGPATFVVETTAAVPLMFGAVRFVMHGTD
jgi:hypothetical protein